jgi:HlyD family secretion protein
VESLSSERAVLAELKAALELNVESATAELQEAQTSMDKSLAAVQVESLEKSLELAETRLSRTIIRAPIAGQILDILTWPGERTHAAEPILRMGNTDQMHAVAEVYETDIGAVRLGQRAIITSPALPKPLAGEVVQIGVSIYKNDVLDVDPAADADARVIEVRIRLDESAVAAKFTNLQVDVEIGVDTDPDG